MQIRQLEYFIAVSEYLNFTKAAKQFYISQAAMTLQIKSLEEELGVQLFYRTNRKVELTPAGRSFVEDAKAIVKRARDAAERAKQTSSTMEGSLSLGFVKGSEKMILTNLLSDFHSTYPNVFLSFTRENVSELYDGLFAGDIDLIINILYSFDDMKDFKDMEYITLKKYPLLAVLPLSHPLANQSSINRRELKDYPLVDIKQNDDRYGERDTIHQSFIEAGFTPRIQYISDDIEISILAVAAGLGYAMLPSYVTDFLSHRDNVVAIPLEGEEERIPIIAAWHKDNQNPALRRFVENIKI